MAETSSATSFERIALPRVAYVRLQDFTLFSADRIVEADVPGGVFCLAGANGLGKSTFLTAVNYAMTGIVPRPTLKFDSPAEYLKKNLSYADDYFTGRISEADRETCEICVAMEIGGAMLTLTRSPFEVESLRDLSIERGGSIESFGDEDGETRERLFREALVAESGLVSFDQFVFLQLLVLTFDERRHLLSWDSKVVEQALYLLFGDDREQAENAAKARRLYEQQDSLARNTQYQVTRLRSQLEDLRRVVEENSPDDDVDLVAQFQGHEAVRDEVDERVKRSEELLSDEQLRLNDDVAAQVELRSEYEATFANIMKGTHDISKHPIVRAAMDDRRCEICGSTNTESVASISHSVSESACPLCGAQLSAVDAAAEAKTYERLEQIDAQLEALNESASSHADAIRRYKDELESATSDLDLAEQALSDFMVAHEGHVLSLTAEDGIGRIAQHLESAIQKGLEQKEVHKKKRDAAKKHWAEAQRDVAASYTAAEDDFIPLFQDLAESFLGLDLSIALEERKPAGLQFVVSVGSSTRRSANDVSESQRYFIDIALRMALCQYVVRPDSPGTLLIDTPEGSLDIAYEVRAGDMLGRFGTGGRNILITANINTSQLLLEVARTCGDDRMRLVRMTEWTELSDVQRASEDLFDSAYGAIEQALGSR